ncbi:amidotransferase [Methanosarcina sp. 2.H.T.1A.6]|uniref:type 1 glutamine amidotransferase n=1 Tax=unclassified Methanosarcina TaxID=2644672 RepID=UPI000621D8F8|nr:MULTISPECIES: type 1 glutamine amidotransferase [unclassified Methanosarcina]KKG18186.1 amidotransferase [Methanosarcina sp. 2.H.T.1A.3]KKG19411.1 amidotransferase [Methanosarcina sp. 2.H.T.1A.6]KKG25548.1 amidotransferase [Methanosarcina sp. 2.H.T.1A.8]KKG26591.1 amidotransferase [Methanosarcina sp. 2.H.T.1A.15]
MKIHVLQHSALNTLGTIEEYARTNNHPLESTRFYKITNPPSLESFDLLVIMGGPMGIYDYEENPWLRDEKAFIKQAIEAGKPVLGICLGAQLLADVLGARVYENGHKEMGWFPVKLVRTEENEPEFLKGLPEKITVFHWHLRTFDLPAGAVHLFRSEGCKNQGFIHNGRVVALQFHPEATDERIKTMIGKSGPIIENGQFIQKKEEMLGQKEYLAETKKFMFKVLDRFEKIMHS